MIDLENLMTAEDFAKNILANKEVKVKSEELVSCPYIKVHSKRKNGKEHPLFGHGKSVSFKFNENGELKLELTPEQKKELKEWKNEQMLDDIQEDFE